MTIKSPGSTVTGVGAIIVRRSLAPIDPTSEYAELVFVVPEVYSLLVVAGY
jgi:hypothetical protein